MAYRRVVSALFFFTAISATGAGLSPSRTMNGIALEPYSGFATQWALVTVRLRKDTDELRFTYANALAWKTLKEGKTDYPDGSVFGKIGYVLKADPRFPSSMIPSGTRRVQLMVRDQAKYGTTDGWGYALFDDRGNTFPEDPQTQTLACAGCHGIVSDLGFVFSRPMDAHAKSILPGAPLKFVSVERRTLPPAILKILPETFKTIDRIEGPIAESIFQGTLDEIIPLLAENVFSSNRPSLLLGKDPDRFSLVIPAPDAKDCTLEGSSGKSLKSVHTYLNKKRKFFSQIFCQTGGT